MVDEVRYELGKIRSVSFGFGGYQEAQFGLWFDLGGKGFGVSDGKGIWAHRSNGAKWTIKDQREAFADVVEYARDLCTDADVKTLDRLVGKPIEVEFTGMTLKSWRILKEVL